MNNLFSKASTFAKGMTDQITEITREVHIFKDYNHID